MSIGTVIAEARRGKKISQEKLAEKLSVSPQAVSSWENDKTEPDKDHMLRLCDELGLTLDEVMTGKTTDWTPGSLYFSPERMYTRVKTEAAAAGLTGTLAALPLMRKKHAGQKRKGPLDAPYIVHPLTMACHALAMNIMDDDVLSAALLHDVAEDTGTAPETLPVSERAQEAVRVLSYNSYGSSESKEEVNPEYYGNIRKNPLACLVKCLDRCNNLSSMADGFTKDHMVKYIKEAEEYVLPLLEVVKAVPEWNDAAWLLKYQMVTMMESFKRIL